MADPITIMGLITAGLKLADQVYIWLPRLAGGIPNDPSEVVEQKGETMVAKQRDGSEYIISDAEMVNLSEWDSVRYNALYQRARANWILLNELDAQRPLLSVDEAARIKIRMSDIRADLCTDLRQMVRISERALGRVALPDHYVYGLDEECGGVAPIE